MIENKTAEQIWETALGELQIQVNKSNYHTWLEKTKGLTYRDDQFVISVPNTFVAEYLDKNQRSLIEKVLAGLTRQEVKVQFQVATNQLNSLSDYGKRQGVNQTQQLLPLFNPRYTFDSFIVGNCNQLAYAAAKGVAQNSGYHYNPLFIHSDVGLGKTHLLQAMGHTALANNKKVLYVSAEQYTNDLMSALRERRTEDFRNKYRSVDMLLVDDVQFFGGKEQTEENFFHTFNDLHNANRQIALTADRPPQSLPLLQERLRSRLEWGLVTEMQMPNFDTRCAILRAKAMEKGIDISTDVLELIAHQIQQNIRALESALNRIMAYAKLIRTLVTPELANQALKNIADNESPTAPITPNLVIETIVNSFQLTPADLTGRKRDGSTVLARQVAMYLIRQETKCSLTEIGQFFGGRSPATVSHAYQKIANDMNNSPSLKRRVFEIQQRIQFTPKPYPTSSQ